LFNVVGGGESVYGHVVGSFFEARMKQFLSLVTFLKEINVVVGFNRNNKPPSGNPILEELLPTCRELASAAAIIDICRC